MIKRLIYALFLTCLWLGGMSLKTVILSSAITLFFTYVIIPLTFCCSKTIQRHVVFLPYVNYPRKVDFNKAENEGLPATRNFYLETDPGVKVGIWHILPAELIDQCPPKNSKNYTDFFENSLSDERPVILYLHGNSSSRAASHRVELYKLLRGHNFHVVAFDYRGYADSTKVLLNEAGVVQDARVVYDYDYVYYKVSRNSRLYVWGHSLGTGVSCNMVSKTLWCNKSPDALILEAPFSNIRDEAANHPLTAIYRKMPKFSTLFLDPLKNIGIEFRSDEHITNIEVPVLIMHAHDDLVVPFMLGKKLFEIGRAHRAVKPNSKPIKFVEFESKYGYGHNLIYLAPELPSILDAFFRTAKQNCTEE